MSMDELDPRKPADALGTLLREDLSAISVEDLEERIAALEGEIARIRREIQNKEGSRDAAEAFFRK